MTTQTTLQDLFISKAIQSTEKFTRRFKKESPDKHALGLLFTDMTLLSTIFAGSFAGQVGAYRLLGEFLLPFVLFTVCINVIWFKITPYTGLYSSLKKGSYKFDLFKLGFSVLLSFGLICIVCFPFFLHFFQVHALALFVRLNLMFIAVHLLIAFLSKKQRQ